MKKEIATKKHPVEANTSVKRKPANQPVKRTQRATTASNATATQPTTSKKDTVITLLRRGNGSALAELMASTGWQAHSVRGFISGTLRKKLGLIVERNQETYRITP
jgi:hypothetical protein